MPHLSTSLPWPEPILRLLPRESFTVGILLNTKGLVELIVLNIGLDVGILTDEIFSGFVLMALFNTFITTPLVWFVWTRHTITVGEEGKKCARLLVFVICSSAHLPKTSRPRRNHPTILACIAGPSSDALVLHVSAALARAQQATTGLTPILNSITYREISERPSSYYFTVINLIRRNLNQEELI